VRFEEIKVVEEAVEIQEEKKKGRLKKVKLFLNKKIQSPNRQVNSSLSAGRVQNSPSDQSQNE